MRRFKTIEKNSRTALVTGASSGIGLCYARRLASLGYRVVAVSNQQAEIQQTAQELASTYGIEALPLYMDLATGEAAEALHAFCRERGLEIEVLVNNAGIFFFREVANTAPGAIETMLSLHVATPTRLCRLFGADMKTRGHGYILNMASLASWMPMPGIALYAATKAYLRSFSRSLWYEMRENGVTVTTVCPGAVATDLYKLSKRYQRLGLRLGVLMPPQRLADKALKAMFRGRKQIVPGAINLFFRWLIALLPDWLVLYAKKKLLKDDAKREA